VIGIDLIKDALDEAEVIFALAGFAFGGAVGILRERDALVATMQRLVIIVLGVLAPVLAVALILFLLSLPLAGLSGLWDSWLSAAALTLVAAGGSYLLLNAAIGLGDEERAPNRVLHIAALALALVVLPLAVLAATALGLRVAQYGWTPERLWGVVCAGIAVAYGLAGWWSVLRGRMEFAPMICVAQTRLAAGVCGLALLLALPIVDFGAISARDQVARLRSGATELADFDWTAMAFDFGPTGRALLQRMVDNGPADRRNPARAALGAMNRYEIEEANANGVSEGEAAILSASIEDRVRLIPAGRSLPTEVYAQLNERYRCRRTRCIGVWMADDRIAVVIPGGTYVEAFKLNPSDNRWQNENIAREVPTLSDEAIDNGVVTIRTVQRRQIFVGDEPVSGYLE
jgi:hypothetical protein